MNDLDASMTLYVSDLSKHVHEETLFSVFRDTPIQSLRIIRDSAKVSRGYGFLKFADHEMAAKALDRYNFTKIDGKEIRIMWYTRDRMKRKSQVGNTYIGHLPVDCTARQVYDTFKAIGDIMSCKIVKGKNYSHAFVQFTTAEAANVAVEKFNGVQVGGEPIVIRRLNDWLHEREVSRHSSSNAKGAAPPRLKATEEHGYKGHTLQFCGSVDASFICSVCFCVLDTPCCTNCGHNFCKNCLQQWLSSSNTCPTCRRYVGSLVPPTNIALSRLIGSIKVLCPTPPLADGKCCRETVTLDTLTAHVRDECQFVTGKCTNCAVPLLRRDMKQHCAACFFKCPHSIRGCTFKGTNATVLKHLQTCPYELCLLFANKIEDAPRQPMVRTPRFQTKIH